MSSRFALTLIALMLPALAEAAPQKTPAARLKRVSQSLEAIAGRAKSSRGFTATAETASGALLAYTGVGLLIGTAQFGKDPNRAKTGRFNQDLGHGFIDAYMKTPGIVLGVGVGAMLTYTGFGLLKSGIGGIFNPYPLETRYFNEFAPQPAAGEAEIATKAERGEALLREQAQQARHDRLYYGWTGLICGGLILIAATAQPEEPAPFFLGGGSAVYGLVSLLAEGPTEEEYASYEAWKSGMPLVETSRGKGFKPVALAGPTTMGLGVSYGF